MSTPASSTPVDTLVFFDVDATLISTDKAGIRAMLLAGRELFRPGFGVDRIEFAGRLDPLIIADVIRGEGLAPTPARVEAFRGRYRHNLQLLLDHPSTNARALPGVPELLAALGTERRVACALLTGNYPETGVIKLRACGLEPERFDLRIWGDRSVSVPPTRDDLPGVGLDEFAARFGSRPHPRRVTVIGDTPHDVRCARAHGCRSIGVATGPYSAQQLRDSGADLALDTLGDTHRVLEFLLA